jgi:hypothetical protein
MYFLFMRIVVLCKRIADMLEFIGETLEQSVVFIGADAVI